MIPSLRSTTLAAGAAALLIAVSALAVPTGAPTPLPAGPIPAGAPPTFADLVELTRPAVVNVSAVVQKASRSIRGRRMPFGPFGHPDAPGHEARQAGSGFVISPDGLAVTNHHVVANATRVEVTLDDGRVLLARVVGSDPETDLAVLEIESEEPLPHVSFGDSDGVRVGDWVVAVGNPFGLGGTYTAGILSARGRDIQAGRFDDFLQVDAPINRGNSGGPLFDLSGRVIGINTAIATPNGGSVGIGFAVPAALAAPIVDELRSTGRVERGWLGVMIQDVDDRMAEAMGLEGARGAAVAEVVEDGPAARAGLEPGDVVVAVNGEGIADTKSLVRAISELDEGTAAAIEIVRRGERRRLEVEIGRSAIGGPPARTEPAAARGRLGLRLAPHEEGALVVAVEPGSPASKSEVRAGDVIVMVGPDPVEGPSDAADRIESVEEGEPVLLLLRRGGQSRFVTVG